MHRGLDIYRGITTFILEKDMFVLMQLPSPSLLKL